MMHILRFARRILPWAIVFLIGLFCHQILESDHKGYYESPTVLKTLIKDSFSYSALASTVVNQITLPENNDSKKRIFLYAKHRSGSTFTLDVFRTHGDIFTLFEPVNQMHIIYKMHSGLSILNDTLNCRLNGLDKTKQNGGKPENARRNEWVREHVVVHDKKMQLNTSRKSFSMKGVERECRKYTHVAVKEVVWFQLDLFAPLLEEGVKVVHLVRDPRGVFSSRKSILSSLNEKDELFNMASHYCNEELRDLAFAQSMRENNKETWEQAYILIRYEDLAGMPNKTVDAIYNVVGILPDEGVRSWVKSLEQLNASPVKTKLKEARYSTSRNNPSVTSASWASKLTSAEIRLIQWACKPFMDLMGYELVTDFRALSKDGFTYT